MTASRFGGIEVDKLAQGASCVMRQMRRVINGFFSSTAVIEMGPTILLAQI